MGLPSTLRRLRSFYTSDMKVLIFGATGMIGQAALRECLLDPDVEMVQTIGRKSTGVQNPKLREVVHEDLMEYGDVEEQLRAFEACFFCLGVTSAGMSEEDYTLLTYSVPMAAAETLARLNPQMTWVHISGAGADSSEQGKVMWARVKGKTENAVLRLPFKAAYVIRPAAIQPMHGERSRTPAYRILYSLTKPVAPLLRMLFPKYIVTTEELGRAMLRLAKQGGPKRVLESADIRG